VHRRPNGVQVEEIAEHDLSPNSWSRFDRASSRWASARTWRPRASSSSTVAPPVNPVAAVTKTVPWLMCALRRKLRAKLDVARLLKDSGVELDVNCNRNVSG
jgi:hypothetical protein